MYFLMTYNFHAFEFHPVIHSFICFGFYFHYSLLTILLSRFSVMPYDLVSVLHLIKQNNIEFFDLKTIDLVGRLHHVTLPVADNTLERVMEQGVGFDGSSFGFAKVESSDMVQKPDLSTVQIDLFRERPTLTCFTNIFLTDEKRSRFSQDVRWVANQAEELLKKLDIADTSFWGPEFEYYIFSNVEYDTRTASSYYKVEHAEEFFQNAYHACSPFDLYDDFRDESCNLLKKLGIPVKYHHHEAGERGQQEIELFFEPLLKAADSIMMVKYILLSQAAAKNLHITFMPKPIFGVNGSGMHVHQSLFKGDKNAFFDARDKYHISSAAKHYIAGLLKHSREITAVTSQWVNSYKRLVPGYEAPVYICWAKRNRSTLIRIPEYLK